MLKLNTKATQIRGAAKQAPHRTLAELPKARPAWPITLTALQNKGGS